MSALSTELLARARWVGLCTARRLSRDKGAWVASAQGSNAPPSIRVEVGRELDARDVDAFAREAIQAITARFVGLEGRIWVVGDAAWQVWRAAGLAEAREGIGAMRSEGAVILTLGGHAGQTLDAVGEVLDASMPTTIEGLLRASVAQDAPGQRIHEAAQRLQWVWSALQAEPRWLLDVCLDPGSPWWNASPDVAAQYLFEALARKAGRPALPLALPRTRREVEAAVAGVTSGASVKATGASAKATVDTWLKQRGEDYAGLNDSGLEVIFTSEHWSAPTATRDAMLAARIAAVRKHGASSERPDFARLAPLPELGPKRAPANAPPGLPLLDAVWILRRLQEAFPGQIVGTHATLEAEEEPYIRVTRVTLRLVDEPTPECALYPQSAVDYGRVRDLGKALVARVRAKKPSPYEGVYEVVISATPQGAPPVTLRARFPWRWSIDSTGRADAVKADEARFRDARDALTAIVQNASRQVDVTAAVQALDALQHTWDALRVEPVVEHAGLREGGSAPWAPAKDFVKAYEGACDAMIELFSRAGNLAARVAEGPLHAVLQFALRPASEGAWRLYGYHPLRLARLLAQEEAALREIGDSLSRTGSLRDVPLVATPPLDGAPTVLWNASDEAPRRDDRPPFLVAADASERDDPWSERYVPFAHRGDTERDLVEPLHPVLDTLCALFPGMSRRASVMLSAATHTDRGLRPLLLMADASRRIVQGVDLYAPRGMVSAHLPSDEETEGDRLAMIAEAMTATREDDAHFPLELFVDPGAREGVAQPEHHVALMVRPSAERSRWSTRAPPSSPSEAAAMVWEPDARAYSQLMVTGEGDSGMGSARLEQAFQRLMVLRWRREADAMPRCLGLSLEGSAEHPDGRPLLLAVRECARRAVRTLVVDRTWGAEAIDALPAGDELRVTYADFHREQGWRVTVVAHRSCAPDRERDAVKRGLMALYEADEAEVLDLAPLVYDATHRAVPEVFRALCRAGSARGARVEGELVGHLGVALFMSRLRGYCISASGTSWPVGWDRYERPMPEGTLVLSMDSLQRWTWTRRSGTRGDFLALIPDATDVRVLAIESKGSEHGHLVDGTWQAAQAAAKLNERFGAAERWQERRELLRCVAEESFRANAAHRAVYDAIARSASIDAARFESACVSTAVHGTGLTTCVVSHGARTVLWVRAAGLVGLRRLAGLA